MITSIKASNFLSWDSLNFDIQEGVTLIDGWNQDDQTPEGSGKSAIFNALCWALYGKIPKDAKIDDVIKKGKASCIVAVSIGDYEITRSRKPNDLYITKGSETIKGKDARETQTFIEKIVGRSFEAFCQTVYFAQNYEKKFLGSNQEQRAKILSEIQDLEIFDRARNEVSKILKEENQKLAELEREHNISVLEVKNKADMIEVLQQQKEKEIKEKERFIQQLKDQQSTVEQRIYKVKEQIEENAAFLKEYPSEKIDKEEEELSTDLEQLENILVDLRAKLKNAENSENTLKELNNTYRRYKIDREEMVNRKQKLIAFIKDPTLFCETCGTALGEKDTSEAEEKLDKLEDDLSSLSSRIKDLEKDIREFEVVTADDLRSEHTNVANAIRKVKTELQNTQSFKNKRQYAEKSLENSDKLLEGLDHELSQISEKIAEEQVREISVDEIKLENLNKNYEEEYARAKELEKVLKVAREKLLKYESLKRGFREIKSFVFNSLLEELNYKVNKYVSQLFESPVKVFFSNDDMKIEVLVNIEGEDIGLGLLSGGQYRRVCIATDLALSEIASSRLASDLNLVIFDEPFQNLSEPSMLKCINMFGNLNKPALIIEHNSIAKSIVDRTFQVELTEGTSKAVA